jgi:phospholipase/carboxylesterase
MYTHTRQFITSGLPVSLADKAVVMLHGRGASAADIASLQRVLHLGDMAIYAPQATNHSWYPYSFMAPVEDNQPALDSALDLVDQVVTEIEANGIAAEQIYFVGFSQGACLTLEYTSRHAKRYGGIIAFTGGLIGQQLDTSSYGGDFSGTPVYISTGDPDQHVPVSRVQETATILRRMNASVTEAIYPGRPHTISAEEIRTVNLTILKQS